MSNFIIMRTQKIKSFGSLSASGSHCSRTRKTDNADPTRLKNNIFLKNFKNVKNLEDNVKNYIAKKNVKIRKNGVIAIEVLLTASPEFFENATKKEKREFNILAKKWLENEFGKNNVRQIVLHMDEATPHIHAHIVPVDTSTRLKGNKVRLNASKWLDGPAKLATLQDHCALAFKPLGLNRGIKKTGAKHKDVKQWYAEVKNAKTTTTTIPNPPLFNKHDYQVNIQEILDNIEKQKNALFLQNKQQKERLILLEKKLSQDIQNKKISKLINKNKSLLQKLETEKIEYKILDNDFSVLSKKNNELNNELNNKSSKYKELVNKYKKMKNENIILKNQNTDNIELNM